MKRPTKRTLLTVVAVGLIVPGLLLSLLGVKLLRDFTEITRGVRSDYGEYMARIAVSAVENAFWDQEQLNMVAARLVPPEDPDEVVRFLTRFQRDNPLYVQAFFVSPVFLVYYSEPGPDHSRTPRAAPAWAVDAIARLMEQHRTMPSGLMHLAAPDSLPPMEITAFTVHSVEGELLGTAAFVWDLDHVKEDRGFLDRILITRLRANPDIFRGAFSRTPVSIALLDEHGDPFFQTGPGAGSGYIATRPFRRVLPFYRVGIRLGDDRFDAWIQSVVATNLAVIVTMFLVIVAAVVFSLRFMLREMELAELKSTFVSNVSHELKTPLALIRLFSETLEMDRVPDPEKRRDFLRVIHKESERLTHLINNVLDVNRIEQGRKTYRIQPTDLAAVMRETLDAYDYQLRQQGFDSEFRLARDLPPVPADPDAMTQALINLLDNAIKYSKESKFLRVELRREDGSAVIAVTDHGVGIPTREQARIFEKFYRVEKSLVHDVKGSGLGLALVKHIVDAHGGRIAVASRPGEGSTFSIHLPLKETAPKPGADGSDTGGEPT